jgi:hypothetical protein
VEKINIVLHKVHYAKLQRKTTNNYAFVVIAKLLTVTLLDKIKCDGDDMIADVSMCYVLPEFPTILIYCSYMFTFRHFG